MQQGAAPNLSAPHGNPWGGDPGMAAPANPWTPEAVTALMQSMAGNSRAAKSQYSPEDQATRAASQARMDEGHAVWRETHPLGAAAPTGNSIFAGLRGEAPAAPDGSAIANPMLQYYLSHWQPPQHAAANPGVYSPFSPFHPLASTMPGRVPLPQTQYSMPGYQLGTPPPTNSNFWGTAF